nr:hypothetical protein BaRGS_016859 [Batillaria attramentaria]
MAADGGKGEGVLGLFYGVRLNRYGHQFQELIRVYQPARNLRVQLGVHIPINLPKTSRVREVGGARHYRTPHGTLFKARALQYSLEPEVDILSDDDWIIHLDEETAADGGRRGCSFFILIFENIASIMAFWMPSETEFYVVKKELTLQGQTKHRLAARAHLA